MLSCQVAELRNGLLSRNLDTKGTKPVLLQRLKEALEAESDTSIKEENAEDGGGKMDMDISDTDDQNEESDIKQTDDVKPPVEKPAVQSPVEGGGEGVKNEVKDEEILVKEGDSKGIKHKHEEDSTEVVAEM